MEALIWTLRTAGGFALSAPFIHSVLLLALMCWDFLFLTPRALWLRVLHGARGVRPWTPPAADTLPAIVVVIPSMMRADDELYGMFSTVESVVHNGYPSTLYVVLTIDGMADHPERCQRLRDWAGQRSFGEQVHVHVTGTPDRRGKPMAIEHAMQHLQSLVDRGVYAEFPSVYVSTDADAELGMHALTRLVERLVHRSSVTGWPPRAVAGNLHLRDEIQHHTLRSFFSVKGQLTLQIARHYLVSNIGRFNLRILPLCGVPGVLYATWSEIFFATPRFMGYLQTLRRSDVFRWWLGYAPPSFAASRAAPIPELIAGDTDDTVLAFMAVIARFEHGKFSFEPPRTPAHALLGALRSLFLDRALRYEPEARVYTSSPTTIKGLFKQRRRWNTARIEVTGRFRRALWFHWTLAIPAVIILVMVLRSWLCGALLYFTIPKAVAGHAPAFTLFMVGYLCHLVVAIGMTIPALIIDGKRSSLRLLLAVPLAPIYALVFAYLTAVVGGVNDLLLRGNITGFAPEKTLIRGGSSRVALYFRARRALSLAVRSVLIGDVPLGRFWFGWSETPWTPNGYEGWTTKRPARRIVPKHAVRDAAGACWSSIHPK
jgi:cellulose synthase/poly-beta-1,6-N-acetylglucosamine synthase-like glycosyltransferase